MTDQAAALDALEDEQVRRRVRHVFTEIARVEEAVDLLEAGDFEGLGAAFTASHVSLRDDYEVSCDELDAVVDVALEHGALGARMTGGGFGGSAIALVPDARVDEVRRGGGCDVREARVGLPRVPHRTAQPGRPPAASEPDRPGPRLGAWLSSTGRP